MKLLLIPVCGKSTRYNTNRPKWLLTNPTGNLMVVDAVKQIYDYFDKIYLICKYDDIKKYDFEEGLTKCFRNNNININYIKLSYQTNSQAETIYESLFQLSKTYKEYSFFIKDCDNDFELINPNFNNNFISYLELNKNIEDFFGKSYIKFDNKRKLLDIVEKDIISKYFSVGGYYFLNPGEYINYYNITNKLSKSELYISDVIKYMIQDNIKFICEPTTNYYDWGTIELWKKYKNTYKTIFIDIDGVLIKNSSEYIKPFIGESNLIKENIEYLRNYCKKYKVTLIYTTSRNEKYRIETEKQLNEIGISYYKLIMSLPHSNRIIINDFSSTNLYKTCESINFPRNNKNLKDYLI